MTEEARLREMEEDRNRRMQELDAALQGQVLSVAPLCDSICTFVLLSNCMRLGGAGWGPPLQPLARCSVYLVY